MVRCGFHGGVWHITARLGMVWIGMGFLAGLGTVQFGGVGLGEVR